MAEAGLVLGVIPLLIAALEHYEEAARYTKDFIDPREARLALVRNLYHLRTTVDQVIDNLLRGIAKPEEVVMMTDDPRNELWTTGRIADTIRVKLGSTYDPFIDALDQISGVLVSIAKYLNIDGARKRPTKLKELVDANRPVDKGPLLKDNFRFKERVKFTMSKRRIEKNLEELKLCTESIGQWTGRAEKSQEITNHRISKKKFRSPLQIVQRHASRLHRALSISWCNSRPQHSTFLLLEQRIQEPHKRTTTSHVAYTDEEVSCFTLSLAGDCFHHLPRLHTEVRIIEPLEEPVNSSQVQFNVELDPDRVNKAPYMNPSNLPQVQQFCHYLKHPVQTSVGFCLNEEGRLRVYSSDYFTASYVTDYLTLDNLLSGSHAKLQLKDQYTLAVKLVASIFQLTGTPWLHTKWTKKDIAFFRAPERPEQRVDIGYPYLVQNFACIDATTRGTTADRAKLLALAVILLEMKSGKSIEQLRLAEDGTTGRENDDMSDYQTAHR